MTPAADDLFEVAGRRVLVCGGAPAALAAVAGLVDRGALVTIVAEELATTLQGLADRGALVVERRALAARDLADAALVVAATGSVDSDAAIAQAATAANRLVLRATVTAPPAGSGRGRVVLVGGGPGDPGLLTVAGLEAVRAADVIVCDRLAPLAALAEARADAEIIDVAKIPRGRFTPQERINGLLVQHATAGRVVVRLKGGDGFVFGRGGEEWQACAAAGVEVTVIPGVTSAVAAPALAGVPLTHRSLVQGFSVVSGHLPPGADGSTVDWAALARSRTTLVIMMGLATLPATTAELVRHGLAAGTPAVTVADGALPTQRSVRGTLGDIADRTRRAGLRAPAVTVIGEVVAALDVGAEPDLTPSGSDGAPG